MSTEGLRRRAHPRARQKPAGRPAPVAGPRVSVVDRPLPPRAAAKQRTRRALIDAAIACFAEQGLDAPSLDAICARAGCTRGAFYVHFHDRDDLMVAAMEQRRSDVLATFLQSAAKRPTLVEVLDLFAQAVEAGAFPLPGAVRTAELLQACRRSSSLRAQQIALTRRTVGLVAELVRADQKEHRVRRDVDAAAIALLVVLVEAGVELFSDLGFPLDVSGAAAALRVLLSTRAGL